ncbi:ArsR/SmtB family transcription factor [Lentilitoribacter sp. EG35]|uniref:ArsR/SmtB family transcription factor n=1 Tax=Lentilitoribacter sp. EG35 TaxID=3234192 RepID=UPI0034601477
MSLSQHQSSTELANTFSALGDNRRLAIVERLKETDTMSITSLCEGVDVSRQAISKHLKVLADAKIVSTEKAGRETLYKLEPARLEEANDYLVHVGAKWELALQRLKSHLE